MKVGLAGMVGAKGAGEAKAKPVPEAPKVAALRECVAALSDGDVDGAAAALGVAVKACMAEYGDKEEA